MQIADPEAQRAEIARLTALFESDPVIVDVTLHEPGRSAIRGQTFFFGREDRLWTSTSCANRVEARRDRLSRCTREYGAFDRLDLLKYEHPYDLGDDSSIIEVRFEYDTAVDVLLK